MHVDVKICGLKTPEALDAALAGGAAYVGFVFFPPSPRSLAVAQAAKLAERAKGKAKIVALSVDADAALLDEIASVLKPDVMQLHGGETPEKVREIRKAYGIPVMKAVKIGGRDDIEAASAYENAADMLLLDAKPRPGEGLGLPGGNGVSFDWRLMQGLDLKLPVMLSGGLDASNVAAAISMSGARAVDVSSGVETAPGVKDVKLIQDFLAAVRIIEGVPA
ncbi:MAG: phosphoribosylanthranilate isomerase [Tepidamorphaceae bacterium]|nr:phosphoribosylanthranilate isomerase [Rhodobiaceae bacterium]MCC0049492.1 phosphoribosylanthranilate isomerase [Rhodobiaceae bacterium]